MKTSLAKRLYQGLLFVGLVAAGVGLVGCADDYYAYPGYYRGGYYGSYASAPYPYYGGYGYPYSAYGYPYRTYGPYYGGYGYPYYGGASVVVSGSRTYTYRDRYGRLHTTRDLRRTRGTARKVQTQSGQVRRSDNDDEQRYYSRP
jgi:hypothetical protein